MGERFMANHLSRSEQLSVLHLLVEGASLRSVTRLTGIHRTTIAKLMVRVGTAMCAFMGRRFCNLDLEHLQCDEIWTFVLKKQGRLQPEEADNNAIGDQYLFVAIDQDTKLIPAFALGKRTSETAQRFMDELANRVAMADLFEPGPRPRISSDGFNAYPNAVDNAFAGRADYGQIIKTFQESPQPGRYGPPILIDTERRVIFGTIEERIICTSHVERSNLTIRTFLRRFTRLALGFSKKLENLEACIALYVTYYNYCWMHGSLSGTPAMAARLAGHPWTLEELLEAAE
jgi:IS1 family transposase